MTQLHLHNSATRAKEIFTPLDPVHVRMYVCGPTVYDRAHLGNARPVIVFDVLTRLLRRLFPRVTYARNITDVDDKINHAAQERGENIGAITETTSRWFHEDMAALGSLPPDVEPCATQHIPEMVAMIERLLARGHAYVAEGHVLFDVPSYPAYGALSGRDIEDQLAGARVEVAPYKKSPLDFVLWKPSTPELPGWDSPWGRGRPGWHIECSAMSTKHLGLDFDIHGGGQDLLFPHHENEVAQSRCADPEHGFARLWMHNGMLRVNGEKMSKSLGNFLTVHDILARGSWAGEAFRLLTLRTHYRGDLDFTQGLLDEAKAELDDTYAMLARAPIVSDAPLITEMAAWAMEPLADDLNTPLALSRLRDLRTLENSATVGGSAAGMLARIGKGWAPIPGQAAAAFREAAGVLGLAQGDPRAWLQGGQDASAIEAAIAARLAARVEKNWAEADRLRGELLAQGIILEDSAAGTTWKRS